MMRNIIKSFVFAGAVVFISCSLSKEKQIGEDAVVVFHEQFNDGKYVEIYNDADEAFRNVSAEDGFVEYLGAVKRKLGSMKKTTQGVWRVDKLTTGTFASLQYQTEYSEGNAVEDFVFLIRNDKATLYRYNINSPILVTK